MTVTDLADVTEHVTVTDLAESQSVRGGVHIQLQHQLVDGRPLVAARAGLGRDIWRQKGEPPPELGERHVLRIALLVEPQRVQQLGAAQLRDAEVRRGSVRLQGGLTAGSNAAESRQREDHSSGDTTS